MKFRITRGRCDLLDAWEEELQLILRSAAAHLRILC